MKVSAVQSHITTLYKAGCRHTLLLLGPPGIGKSESTRNASKILEEEYNRGKKESEKEEFGYRQWQATIEDPLELPGLPAVLGSKAVRVPFEDKIPTSGRGILCIDEINSAPPLTQCSLYSLVWDRMLGGTRLGEDWMIVATGNHDKDRAVTQRMPTPLVSRMEHIDVEPDVESWLTKMAVDGLHDTVRAFIKTRPDMFVTFKAEVPGPFACPRTWTMTGKVMNAYGKETPPFESIKGWIGDGPATEFLSYHMMAKDLVDVDEIIRNPKKAHVPQDNPGALYALTTNLASRMNFQNVEAILQWLGRTQVEFAVYCIASARDVERGRLVRMSPEEQSKYKKLEQNQAFRQWCLDKYELIKQ